MFTNTDNETTSKVGVTLVASDSDLQRRVRLEFGEHSRFDLSEVNGNLSQSEDKLFNGALQSVIIVELDPESNEELAALERLKNSRLADKPVIVVSEFLEEMTVRRLLRMKVTDWLPKISPAGDFVRSCERALQLSANQSPALDADVYAFFPSAGGVGNTTLAIQTAFHLGTQSQKLATTCLVDLNLQTGAVADYLNLTPAFDTKEVAAAPDRLDKQLLEVMLSRHESGLAVLAAPKATTHYREIDEHVIAAVLGLTSEMFDIVVVDLPQIWFPWTNNILLGADKFFIVSEFTVPALRHARLLLDSVRAKEGAEAEISVIVNKFKRRILGGGLVKKDASHLLHDGLAGFIPDEGALVREAIDRGVPLSKVHKSNGIERELGRILTG